MMKLIALMLLGLVSLVEGEVVDSFAESCPEFFIKDQNRPVTPTVLVSRDQNGKPIYRQICQKYKGRYRYATLYDMKNRIPVYSAYQYTRYATVNPRTTWFIEPGLDGHSETEMTTEAQANKAGGSVGTNQAVKDDYIDKQPYQKGHLYPHCHNCDQDQSDSTYTLTNAAPQDEEDNKDWYGQVEKVIGNHISNWCKPDSAHVVTGVVPGDVWMKKKNVEERVEENVGERVKVPSCFWSAFCCTHRQAGGGEYSRLTEYSRGFLAYTKTGMRKLNNEQHHWKMVAEEMSVGELNGKLRDLYDTQFEVFGNLCLW